MAEQVEPLTFELLQETAIGFLGLHPQEWKRWTFRQFYMRVEAKHTEKEDDWDIARNIMAAMTGQKPKRILKLKRDKIIITPEEKIEIQDFHDHFKKVADGILQRLNSKN